MSKSPVQHKSLMKVGVTAAAALAMLLTATGTQAQAQTPAAHSAHPAKPAHPAKQGKPGKRPAVHFTAEGLVTAHTASTVTVLAHNLRVGKTLRHNQMLVVHVAAKPGKHAIASAGSSVAGAIVGDRMSVTGTTSGSGTDATFTATHLEQHNTPGHAYLGVVVSVDGTIATISKAPQASDAPGEDNNGEDTFTVDTANATTLVDGAPGVLAAGDTVVVLGEGDHDTILAASIYAYTTAPAVIAGEVTSANGNILTIAGNEDSDTTIDLTGVPLIVDGQLNTQPDALSTAASAMILGSTDAAGTFTPTAAFVFTSHDDHPLLGSDSGDNND